MLALDICKKRFDNAEIYPCRNGAAIVKIPDCTTESFAILSAQLADAGYEYYTGLFEGDVLFSTFTAENEIINLSYTPSENMVRAVCENGKNLPPRAYEVDAENTTTPLVTQLRIPYSLCDCGMSYVIRLCDGKFIIIDGGEGEYDEADRMMDVIKEQNVLENAPVVAAWFVTHAHSDHFNGLVQIWDKYGANGKIKIERLIYNWPVPDKTAATSPLDDFDRVVSEMTDTQIITAHSGQKYNFAGTQIDVLYACEDLYPDFIRTLNDTSIVFRMTINDRRIMWLGDIMGQGSEFIVKRYPAESLKCEIMQVGHHGYWGGSHELYRRVAPETLLWPCPDFWYQEIKDWDCNRVLKESENIKHIFVAGQEETVLDMTKPVRASEPYKRNDNSVIREESFDGGSVAGLNMSCITGGNTGYRPVHIGTPKDGECKFTAGNALSVCELIQPGFLAGEKKTELEIKGKAEEECEKMGLVFNNAHPTVWSEIKALWLYVPRGTDFEYKLMLDYESGKGVLYSGGTAVKRIEFVPQSKPCGIYLIMKNAKIILNKVKAVSTDR